MNTRQNPTWSCKIGFLGECDLPNGADAPMRRAVAAAFEKLTGVGPQFNFSGWGTPLDEQELAVVENRLPSEEYRRRWHAEQVAPELLEALQEIERHCDARGLTAVRGIARAAIRKALAAQVLS